VEPSTDPVRIDKWLWAARLFKTRGLATEAVVGGRVQVNGARVKPSKDVRPGDEVDVTFAQGRRVTALIAATAERRGPASFAQRLYDETPESIAAREAHAAERRLAVPPAPVRGEGRPTKRDRRRLEAMREGMRRGGRGR
jgi:ribosome-associated heat shock protein Hsp15